METLWFFSGAPRFFLVPKSKLLIDQAGQLLPIAIEYVATIGNVDDFRGHIQHAKIIVLVAEDKLFDSEFLAAIPQEIPKIVIVGDNSPTSVRQQLNALRPEGYLFGVISAIDFSDEIHKAYSNKTAITQVHEELQKYTNIAFAAMSSASEMGIVALFAERTQSIMDISRLAQLVLGCVKDLNVDGMVQFSFDDDISVYPNNIPDAHKKLMLSTRMTNSRIISHGRFLIISFAHVQLLITDAPCDDMERYGRLRDILAPVVSITEARLKTLKVNMMLKEQQENSRKVMMLLEMASKDNRNSVRTIMTELSLSLREMSTGLELTLTQEKAMIALSNGALQSLEVLHVTTGAVEEHFRSLLEQLDTAASLLRIEEVDEIEINESSKVQLF